MNQSNALISLHDIDLELEFMGVGPVVVTFTESDIFGIRVHRGIHDTCEGAVTFAVLVLGLINGLDDVGVPLDILADDGGGTVGRSIVMDNGLKGESRLLHHEAIQALPQVWLMIINQTTNRY